MKTIDQIWGVVEVAPGETETRQIGDLQLRLRHANDELQIANKYMTPEENEKPARDGPQEHQDWMRWVVREKTPRIEILPVFPDRPVVVKPESPFTLVQKARARIFVRVPLFVQIKSSTGHGSVLIEFPSVILSRTLFGSVLEGELCYWISSGARRTIAPDPTRPFLAICTMKLVNDSQEDVKVEKIRLPVDTFSLFSDGQQLWADEVTVTLQGADGRAQIKASAAPPPEAGNATRMSSPRNPQRKGLAAKTVSSLKDLPGLGIF